MRSHSTISSVLALAVAAAVVWSAAGCGQVPQSAGPASHGRAPATLVRVIDGDTVVLRLGHDDIERVRIIGVDTPETVKPNTPIQCWGPQASSYMKHLLTPGTKMLVARDADARDKYGRLLLYLWRASDNLFVNLQLALGGWGRPLTIPPNTAHEADIAAAVAKAQAAHRGLWGACGSG